MYSLMSDLDLFVVYDVTSAGPRSMAAITGCAEHQAPFAARIHQSFSREKTGLPFSAR